MSICQATTKQGKPCSYKAKFEVDDCRKLCGIHKGKKVGIEIKKKEAEVKKATTNLKVQLSKMAIRRKLIHEEGYKYIFPNYRHRNRKDGKGLPSLSPMSLGPVQIGKMPKSLCLENWWQGSKVLSDEVDSKGKILPSFYKTQKEFAESKIPYRRKRKGAKTLGWLYTDKDGKEHLLDYVTSRQFYCNVYANLVVKEKEFKELKDMYDKYKICIAGYDAHPISSYQDLKKRYYDTSKPYGHEIVLCALLVLKPEEYPWRTNCTFGELKLYF